MADISNP
jgi:F-type H+-transporting ATPase subunit k